MTKPGVAGLPADWTREEPLSPSLERWISDGPVGPMIRSPLVVDIMPMIEQRMCNRINTLYAAKLAEIRKLRRAEQYEKMLWIFERPWRLDFLVRYKQKMLDNEAVSYWRTLRGTWADAEWPSRLGDAAIEYLFQTNEKYPHGLMLKAERDLLKKLPDTVTIFRGVPLDSYRQGHARGWSWTFSPEAGWFFARRFSKRGALIHGTIQKEDIIFFSDVRGEREVVVPPMKVEIVGCTQD